MIHLRAIRLGEIKDASQFPLNLPVLKQWDEMTLNSPVTFFVGENGSGKSTIMEALAIAAGSITVGSENVVRDPTLDTVRALSDVMRLSWQVRTRRGFFFRAEDFFGFVKRVEQQRAEMRKDLEAVDEEYKDRSVLAQGLAKMPYARELHGIQSKYGDGLDTQSHGESFLALFQSRFVPKGLYLLDEPEAALSPLRQLGFLSLLKDMVGQESQFIIATHSPILMAYPGAEIYNFDQTPPALVPWEDLEHVTLTRDFLNNPKGFLRHL